MSQKSKFILESVENFVGKGENAGNHHLLPNNFLPFLKCFNPLPNNKNLPVVKIESICR